MVQNLHPKVMRCCYLRLVRAGICLIRTSREELCLKSMFEIYKGSQEGLL